MHRGLTRGIELYLETLDTSEYGRITCLDWYCIKAVNSYMPRKLTRGIN